MNKYEPIAQPRLHSLLEPKHVSLAKSIVVALTRGSIITSTLPPITGGGVTHYSPHLLGTLNALTEQE